MANARIVEQIGAAPEHQFLTSMVAQARQRIETPKAAALCMATNRDGDTAVAFVTLEARTSRVYFRGWGRQEEDLLESTYGVPRDLRLLICDRRTLDKLEQKGKTISSIPGTKDQVKDQVEERQLLDGTFQLRVFVPKDIANFTMHPPRLQ